MARIRRALARFEDSLWGDAVGVVCLFGMLGMALYAPLLWRAP